MKKSTVRLKLAAFKWAYATVWGRGQVNSGVGSVLYLTQRAIGRRADDREPKLAVGAGGLRAMWASLHGDWEADRELQCWAWWTLSYRAYLRCSEAATIRWEDVSFGRDEGGDRFLWFRLTVSGRQIFKNHSESVEFKIRRGEGQECAVRAMAAWCRQCGRPRGGRVFALDAGTCRTLFQEQAARALGGAPRQYGLHSLRAGAATDAEMQGCSFSEIMFLGRGQSTCVLQYMRAGERLAAELGVPRAGGRGVRAV